jgi:hypothetical protein
MAASTARTSGREVIVGSDRRGRVHGVRRCGPTVRAGGVREVGGEGLEPPTSSV